MKIRQFNTVQLGVYIVALRTEDWSEADRTTMANYGEPEINLGGTFETEYVAFTLPSINTRLMTGTQDAVSNGFDSRDYADAEARATLWAETISARIADAVTALREHTDTFTGETVVTI